MKRVFLLIIFLILISCPAAQAQESILTEMKIERGMKAIRINFDFNHLPQYRLDVSGQRVDFIMFGTTFASKFDRIDDHEDIVRILYHEHPEKSVVSFLFHNIPEDVNSSTSDQKKLVHVDIVWPEGKRTMRPAIDYDIEAKLHFDNRKSTARRYITSKYSNNWKKFFQEFEWPIEFNTSRNYFFPEFPCYVGSSKEMDLDNSILENGYKGYWNKALGILRSTKKDASSAKKSLLRLIECDLLIRQGEFEEVKRLSNQLMMTEGNNQLNQWASYIYDYSLAMTGEKYQAYYDLQETTYQDIAKKNDLRFYYQILLGELALATQNYEKAFKFFSKEKGENQYIRNLFRLRKADTLIGLGQEQKAYELYQSLSYFRYFMEKHPWSLTLMAKLAYKQKKYGKSFEYFTLLQKGISSLQEKSLAKYWAAMSLYRQGKRSFSREHLQETLEDFPDKEGGLRARIKLNDLCLLEDKSDWQSIIAEYQDIAEKTENRNIREESTFKKILTFYEANKEYKCVHLLEAFLRNYFGGKLKPVAEALMVEVLPDVVKKLVDQGNYFQAMVLVERNRKLLINSPLSLRFLTSLAKAFFESGLYERAEKVYSYILAGADEKEVKDDIFLLLIKTLFEKEEMDRVVNYADLYCNQYPKGNNLVQVYLYKVRALRAQGKNRQALRVLLEKKRPLSDQLDIVTGQLLFDLKKYKQVEAYLSRGLDPYWQTADSSVILLRAESLYQIEAFQKALPYYKFLIQEKDFIDQSMYRRGYILYKTGQERESFNVLERLVEKSKGSMWAELAQEFLVLHKG